MINIEGAVANVLNYNKSLQMKEQLSNEQKTQRVPNIVERSICPRVLHGVDVGRDLFQSLLERCPAERS